MIEGSPQLVAEEKHVLLFAYYIAKGLAFNEKQNQKDKYHYV